MSTRGNPVAPAERTAVAKRGSYAKSEPRRNEILVSAVDVFSRRGFRGGSMREIALGAGIALSTLRHHFRSKEHILLAVLQQRDRTDVFPPDAGDAERLRALILERCALNEQAAPVLSLYSLLAAESTTGSRPGAQHFSARFIDVRANFAGALAQIRDAGRLAPGVDIATAAALIVAAWDGIQVQWLIDRERVSMGATLGQLLDLLIVPAADERGAPA